MIVGMVTGYVGTYRASVVDDADPMQESRLQVLVPDVYGDGVQVWAVPLFTGVSGATIPVIGDLVWVSFEHGDSDYPVWQADQPADDDPQPSHGYTGKYRGIVVGNEDPLQQQRLEVTVSEVDQSPAWATPSSDVQYIEAPEVGAQVWIEYDNGDPSYPRWVGLA
jgi:hypothetical protein